jgi:hypothetical protein
MRQVLALALFLAGANASNAAQLACHDLLKHEPSSLTGELQLKILPGPPEYEDVQSGDIPEPTYLLELDADICLEGVRWSRLVRQFGGLAKVDRVGFYAANFSIISAVA